MSFWSCDAIGASVSIMGCQQWYHMLPIASSMETLNYSGQGNQNEVQYNLCWSLVPLLLVLASHDTGSIIM